MNYVYVSCKTHTILYNYYYPILHIDYGYLTHFRVVVVAEAEAKADDDEGEKKKKK